MLSKEKKKKTFKIFTVRRVQQRFYAKGFGEDTHVATQKLQASKLFLLSRKVLSKR